MPTFVNIHEHHQIIGSWFVTVRYLIIGRAFIIAFDIDHTIMHVNSRRESTFIDVPNTVCWWAISMSLVIWLHELPHNTLISLSSDSLVEWGSHLELSCHSRLLQQINRCNIFSEFLSTAASIQPFRCHWAPQTLLEYQTQITDHRCSFPCYHMTFNSPSLSSVTGKSGKWSLIWS